MNRLNLERKTHIYLWKFMYVVFIYKREREYKLYTAAKSLLSSNAFTNFFPVNCRKRRRKQYLKSHEKIESSEVPFKACIQKYGDDSVKWIVNKSDRFSIETNKNKKFQIELAQIILMIFCVYIFQCLHLRARRKIKHLKIHSSWIHTSNSYTNVWPI